MSRKRDFCTPSFDTRAKKKKTFETSKFNIAEQSPTLDTATPNGKALPQSQGPYKPVKKVGEEPVYHAMPLQIVPLKKKRGRPTKRHELLFNRPLDIDFEIKPCGYIDGNILTYSTYSLHSRHSVVCQCKLFVSDIKKTSNTWHWYQWWKNAKTSARYQFLFHHIGFNVLRAGRHRKSTRLPPSHLSNISVPGLIKTYTICAKQFFFLVGKDVKNYGIAIRRVWQDTVINHLHDTQWKPTRTRDSKWFHFFRTEFPKWHTIVHGHYSKSDRKAMVDLTTMSAHIIREDGFNKLDDYWEEFIRKSPHINSDNQIQTMVKQKAFIKWKQGKRNLPKPPKPSTKKVDQPLPTRDTFRVIISKKCNLKRKGAKKIKCPVCTSLDTWIQSAEKAKDRIQTDFLVKQLKLHKARYDWHRRKIQQAKDTARESWFGFFPENVSHNSNL